MNFVPAFSSFSEFLHMGGYGDYVWMSFGVTALILSINLLEPYFRKQQIRKDILQEIAREKRRAK